MPPSLLLLSDTKENINSLQEPQEQAVSTRKIPQNAKWISGDDATLLDSLKTFADRNLADNGTFKSAAKALKDSHKTSGGALKTVKSCSCRWATTRKIVIASDKVWDDYLEAHPEAKTSPPWPSTLLLDDENDVFIGEDALGGNHESESADEKVLTPISHTPRVPKHGHAPSVSPASTGVHKKCSNAKLTGPAAILGVADALESVATLFTAPTSFLDDAVCADASLSSDECAKVVALFTKDVYVPLHSMYIHLELRKI
ncbi:uncharacterized protein EDB91DRAFT_1240231 [Suillus paluster]|uniref:uncharacterized protein n=1 Tax=Suillus paluster TaxID=48578 RepID=UPI001B87959D|nr:uncharacterized protein EDB91DRAFT_1240231 [Suillus paluster]KAG1722289.1 hypothetical protein EDB91DRAFT_1240231 [Suillus paluster]